MITTRHMPVHESGNTLTKEYKISWVNTACVMMWTVIIAMYVLSLQVI